MIKARACETGERAKRLTPELYPPGQCIHFYRDGFGISAAVTPNSYFGDIDVSRRMIDDHLFFTGYQKTLLEVMRMHTGDHHFRFDADKQTRSESKL